VHPAQKKRPVVRIDQPPAAGVVTPGPEETGGAAHRGKGTGRGRRC
jgi:hypothetical protein